MTNPNSSALARACRLAGKTALISAGGLAGAQLTVVGALATIDGIKQRGRRKRDAPRPGTFHAQVKDSRLSVYTSGDTLFDDMIEAIDGAQSSIQLETYIWKGDEMGQRFIDALNRAGARGVRVHVIYDGFANLVVKPSFFGQFSDAVDVWRMPVVRRGFWKGVIRHTGLDHSKVLVVDDAVAFVGGYNIGSMYARQWRDTHVRAIGPAVWGLRNSISRKWNTAHAPEDHIPWIPADDWNQEVHAASNIPLQLVYPIRGLYLTAIERARDHIYVNTPYFVPDQQILSALLDASRRGVDVRVMLPKDSNHIVADWVSRGFYKEMLDAGVTILLYRASMIHAKTATIDGQWSTVGTANIDRLSLSFNYETNVEIVDAAFAAEVEKVFAADSEHCEVLTPAAWNDRPMMARAAEAILAPLRPFM